MATTPTARDSVAASREGRGMSAADRAIRDEKIWQRRLDGADHLQIGNEFGITQARVSQILSKAIKERRADVADRAAEWALARIERMRQQVNAVLNAEHIVISHGHIIRRNIGGEWDTESETWIGGEWEDVTDHDPILRAVDRLLKIDEREAKLLGLDSPTKVETTSYNYTVNGIDANDLK